MILRPKKRVVALATISLGIGVLVSPIESSGQDRHRCWWFSSRREREEYAAEAASLGVRGGAPAMGFPDAVVGLGRGVVRIPFPPSGALTGASGGPSSGSYETPGAIVPPQPAASGLQGPIGGGPIVNEPKGASVPGAAVGPSTAPNTKPGLSPLPTTTTSPSGHTVGPSPGSP
jgi:hypothetical protein